VTPGESFPEESLPRIVGTPSDVIDLDDVRQIGGDRRPNVHVSIVAGAAGAGNAEPALVDWEA
jgi:hypothetical protein